VRSSRRWWRRICLGQNTAAIAATEAQYGEMWAQDAAAMYGYAGSSAVAAAVTSFNSPPEPRTSEGRWVARRKGRVAPLSSELWQCTAYPEIPEATWAQPLIREELS
jgi:hypothetical protein